MGKTFAYIRVSTREQKEDRQLDSLAGITVDEIIIEKAKYNHKIKLTLNEEE